MKKVKLFEDFVNESNIKVGDKVIRKFASEDMDSYVVLSISNGKAGLKNVKTGKKTGMFLNDLLKESETVMHEYDFLGMQAQAANMTREEWIAHYGTPEIGSGIDEAKKSIYTVFFYDRNEDDWDWDVEATSPEEAIQLLKDYKAKGPHGELLPRGARKFSAQLKK